MVTLVINYKAYPQAFEHGLDIAVAARRTARDTSVDIIVAPPDTMLKEISKSSRAIAQHMDPIESGAFTGRLGALEIKRSNAIGAILNHSENPMSLKDVETAVPLLREKQLLCFVCTSRTTNLEKMLRKEPPTHCVYEPTPLIGGEISVSEVKKEEVKKFVWVVNDFGVIPIIGAGIRTRNDAEESIELGAKGVFASSAIMLSKDFARSIQDIATGLCKGL